MHLPNIHELTWRRRKFTNLFITDESKKLFFIHLFSYFIIILFDYYECVCIYIYIEFYRYFINNFECVAISRRDTQVAGESAIYLSCQQFSEKWGARALDLMRRIRTAKRQCLPRSIHERSTLGPPFLSLLGSCVGSVCFRGQLMKYPCRFNRVTSPASHPKGENADPMVPSRYNNKKTYCPRIYSLGALYLVDAVLKS